MTKKVTYQLLIYSLFTLEYLVALISIQHIVFLKIYSIKVFFTDGKLTG